MVRVNFLTDPPCVSTPEYRTIGVAYEAESHIPRSGLLRTWDFLSRKPSWSVYCRCYLMGYLAREWMASFQVRQGSQTPGRHNGCQQQWGPGQPRRPKNETRHRAVRHR